MAPKKSLTNIDSDVLKALIDTQRHLDELKESPALNGGFNVLMNKIDALQETQDQLKAKVEAIHEAIYHPDEGIYARIKNSASRDDVQVVEKKVETLEIWKDVAEKGAAAAAETHDLIRSHEDKIAGLIHLKESTVSVLKKVALGIGGGMLTLICKIVYSLVTGHVHLD